MAGPQSLAAFSASRGGGKGRRRNIETGGMATKATEREDTEGDTEALPKSDGPLLDLTDAAVKRMIKLAKKRGYVTYDELNQVLPSEEFTSEQIEDVLGQLSEMGINVVEAEEAEEGRTSGAAEGDAGGDDDEGEGGEVVEQAPPRAVAIRETATKEPTDRTDDPVRMYLREMGSVELLSREGEIAIAKRIEAGREAMIAGLCESPLTFQAIIIWRDELVEGRVLLRDIIDLEATYAGPDGKGAPKVEAAPNGSGAGLPTPPVPPVPPVAAAPAPAAPSRFGIELEDGEEAPPPPPEDLEDDDLENNVSLSAMEAELKPKVLETFDSIADNYKKLRRLQVEHVDLRMQNKQLTPAQERKYKKLKEEIVRDVKTLSLNANRIEALVEQLYDINKRLISHEGRLMRLAESYGVSRDEFLRHYQGWELDPKWLLARRQARRQGLEGLRRPRQGQHPRAARADPQPRLRDRPGDPGVPQDRLDGPEGRARGAPGQEGDDRGQPAPRHLDRQEIHQPRPAVPRPHPGGQHRPDEGGRQVRVPPRLQVLDLRHLVDPPGDHPLDRRPGPHHPHPGAHDRDDQQDRAHARARCCTRSAASRRRRSWPRSSPCRWRRCARS